jgi:hypothetical protein
VLEGTILDASCGEPISRMSEPADVVLTEIVPEGATPTIRLFATIENGAYRIGGLEPAVEYDLTVSHPAIWPPVRPVIPVYGVHHDTVSFSSGETATMDAGLTRQISVCDTI